MKKQHQLKHLNTYLLENVSSKLRNHYIHPLPYSDFTEQELRMSNLKNTSMKMNSVFENELIIKILLEYSRSFGIEDAVHNFIARKIILLMRKVSDDFFIEKFADAALWNYKIFPLMKEQLVQIAKKKGIHNELIKNYESKWWSKPQNISSNSDDGHTSRH